MNGVKNPPNMWFITSSNANRGFICLLSQTSASMFIFALFCHIFSSSASFYSSFSALRVSGDSFSPLSHKQTQLNIFSCCVWKKKKKSQKLHHRLDRLSEQLLWTGYTRWMPKTKCELVCMEFWTTFLFENAKTTWKLYKCRKQKRPNKQVELKRVNTMARF